MDITAIILTVLITKNKMINREEQKSRYKTESCGLFIIR